MEMSARSPSAAPSGSDCARNSDDCGIGLADFRREPVVGNLAPPAPTWDRAQINSDVADILRTKEISTPRTQGASR